MKRFLCLILAAMLVMISAGCAFTAEESAVFPPSRIGQGTVQASLGSRYTFESALAAADVVARIEVGNWLSEDTKLHKTYYEATVLQCFKGEISETFTLLQDGCSAATMKNYPLFTYGNELLVFLKEAELTGFESPYWIIGSFTTVLDVSYDKNGARYFADRYGILGEFTNAAYNYALESVVSDEVLARVVADDPIVSEMEYAYPYIFSEADIMTLLGSQ